MEILSAQNTTLPLTSGLDIAALSRLFSNTTTSYKYIFFLSYLDILKRKEFHAVEPISFRELTIEMLANAWYPHTYFKLSFGRQDLIAAKLDSLNLEISEPILKFRDADKKLLRGIIDSQLSDDSLMRYVPFRTLRPFFEEELKGVDDYKIDSTIARLSAKYFTTRKPIYSFINRADAILPHPLWAEYFKLHFAVIRSWAAWQWLGYMQRCNQVVPAISAKLFPPNERDSLKAQTEYWKLVIKNSEAKCIYSGEDLCADRRRCCINMGPAIA